MISLKTSLSVEKCKDSGLALVLISLVCYQVWKEPALIIIAIVLLLAAMTYPRIFKPFAVCWFALSAALGAVTSKIILTVLYVVLVVPVGLLRRMLGKDSMQLNNWKIGEASVFRVREHKFTGKNLEHPY